MASMSYEDIFGVFLDNITDYSLASMNESEAYKIMGGYLHQALADMYIRRLFTEYSLDDPSQTLEYTMKYVLDEESDTEFVRTILGKGMVKQWVAPQVQSVSSIRQMMSDKERTIYSQSAHLKELQELKKNVTNEIRKLIQDRGYIYNTYLDEED